MRLLTMTIVIRLVDGEPDAQVDVDVEDGMNETLATKMLSATLRKIQEQIDSKTYDVTERGA